MKKITELTEKKYRTRHSIDFLGNRVKNKEEYTARRPVYSVSPGIRFAHFFVDQMCFQAVILVLQLIFVLIGSAFSDSIQTYALMNFVAMMVSLLCYPFLYFMCEAAWQKTPGKFLTNCVVIDEYGNKPDRNTLVLRSIIRLVPFESFSCLEDKSHGWHDRWSKTWVVPEKEYLKIKELLAQQSEETPA